MSQSSNILSQSAFTGVFFGAVSQSVTELVPGLRMSSSSSSSSNSSVSTSLRSSSSSSSASSRSTALQSSSASSSSSCSSSSCHPPPINENLALSFSVNYAVAADSPPQIYPPIIPDCATYPPDPYTPGVPIPNPPGTASTGFKTPPPGVSGSGTLTAIDGGSGTWSWYSNISVGGQAYEFYVKYNGNQTTTFGFKNPYVVEPPAPYVGPAEWSYITLPCCVLGDSTLSSSPVYCGSDEVMMYNITMWLQCGLSGYVIQYHTEWYLTAIVNLTISKL